MKKTLLLLILITIVNIKIFGQYKTGHYYTKDGLKVTGLLRFNYGGNAFIYC